MRKLRKQNRNEVVIDEPIITEDNSQASVENKSFDNVDIEIIKKKYEDVIKKLESENKKLKRSDSRLTKNEEKLIAAIRSEIINQDTETPIIGRRLLIEEYNIGRKYLDEAIKGLISKGLIKRKYVKFTANVKTSSWEIITQ